MGSFVTRVSNRKAVLSFIFTDDHCPVAGVINIDIHEVGYYEHCVG